MSKKVLLTSVCKPIGPKHGYAPSVGYELLHGQVTRSQGLFSPRAVHRQFSLDYIAANLDAPTVVLHYPSRSEFIRELRKGYDYIGVAFIMAVMHNMKEMVALIRQYSPQSKIILGGYGTILKDEELKDYGDYFCREEGVAFMRRLLGEPELPMPYHHPLLISELKVFGQKVSRTGLIFAGLGCPNGCDFCCTSHFFQRRHIRLLPTGKDIFAVIERYLDQDPNTVFTILDEDFLLNKERALEFRDCLVRSGRTISMFAFSSIKALSQYTVEEILEMGLDGFWIGYEGTRSGYAKQQGRTAEEIFTEFRQHGITILASMIVGFEYQTPEIIGEELAGLLALKPALGQYLIYGPVPGTPFYERITKAGLLREKYTDDRQLYYRSTDGFSSLVKHPSLTGEEVEAQQRRCFDEDFQKLGPSIFRVLETRLLGLQKLKNSPNPLLRQKAAHFAKDLREAYPVFLAGKLLGPNPTIRRWIADLEQRLHAELGQPKFAERAKSVAALGAALWTGVTLKFDYFQHPELRRNAYRLPETQSEAAQLWERFRRQVPQPGLSVQVELQPAQQQVLMRLEGTLSANEAAGLAQRLRHSLENCKNHLVLDLQKIHWETPEGLRALADQLSAYRSRIRLVLPKLSAAHPELLLLASIFQHYRG